MDKNNEKATDKENPKSQHFPVVQCVCLVDTMFKLGFAYTNVVQLMMFYSMSFYKEHYQHNETLRLYVFIDVKPNCW